METSATSSSSCPLPRLLRCFCNCSELSYDDVRVISQLNVPQLLAHPQGLRLFKAFLRVGTTTVRPVCLRHVEHAELCSTVITAIANGSSSIEATHIDDLFENCASLDWEQRLEAAVASEMLDELAEYCAEARLWTVACIADDAKWTEFKQELRRKLGL